MFDTMMHMGAAHAGRVLLLPAVLLFVLLCMYLVNLLHLDVPKPAPRPGEIPLAQFKVPAHEHVIDFERSSLLAVRGDGTILARCAVQGCDVQVRMGFQATQTFVETRHG